MSGRQSPKRHVVNRRAFLYGAGGIAIGLPFLEGLPERSAWAQEATPIFTFFICAACGVEPKRFWPEATGDLATVLASGDKAVNELKDHAANLLIVKGVNFPNVRPSGCGHAEGLSQALTGSGAKGSGSGAQGNGPSVDFVISQAVNASGTTPLTLYAGNLNNGYIEERLSYDASGKVRAATDNPYKLYQTLTSVAKPAGSDMGSTEPPPPTTQELLLKRRKSVNDLVKNELNSLLQSPKASAADKQRLQQHFDAIRAIEMQMMDPDTQVAVHGCTLDGIDTALMDSLSKYKYTKSAAGDMGREKIVELHMQLVALAFACNQNRTGSLQWGDGTDATIYDVPSNKTLGNWGLHYISHRTASDSAVGQNATAEAAHAEIDVLRMQTVARGLNHFRDRGLQDQAIVVWTNHVAEGNHKMENVPYILWGNGGGAIKQGEFVDADGENNATLYNVVISAATGMPTTDFGSSAGKELTAIKAV